MDHHGDVRLNWKVHLHGRGAAAHSMRSLLAALATTTGAELSIEDIAPHRRPGVAVPAELAATYLALAERSIDPRRFWHIRHATPQEEERHLLAGRVDVSPYGRNVWYLTPETSRYAIVPRDVYTRHLTRAWVPSTHSARALVEAGVPAGMIDCVPHGVDTGVFHPPDRPHAGSRFTFLSVVNATGWKRKGLDVLVRAYLAAFQRRDEVVLLIHSRKGADSVGRLLAAAGYREDTSPPVEVRAGRVDSIVERYHAADCYVQLTRGEAFGLAILEAMACGLPVLVTGWGGHLDFCAGAGSLLVDSRLEPVDGDPDRRGSWAEPSLDHAVDLLRTVWADREWAARVGADARRVAARWSWRRSAGVVVDTVRRLEGRLS
jgi:glycosyltransferase involved in cell wall biosynthesis